MNYHTVSCGFPATSVTEGLCMQGTIEKVMKFMEGFIFEFVKLNLEAAGP